MKNAILIISLFAALNAFADICPDWDENTVYNAGDDVCYNNQPYEVAPNVYNISGYTYRPDGPFAHFWQGTDDCDCEVQPQEYLWERDPANNNNISNINTGSVGVGITPTGNANLEVLNKIRVLSTDDPANRYADYNHSGIAICDHTNNEHINIYEGHIELLIQNLPDTYIYPGSISIGNTSLTDNDISSNEIKTNLLKPIGSGNLEVKGTLEVEKILNIGLRKNVVIENGELYVGSSSGNTTIVGPFISLGADPHKTTISNRTITTGTLEVRDEIKTRKLVVTEEGWADKVFKRGYKMKSLDKIELYINKNGHLPGIPSENEVKKNGVNVGEMQVKLLAQIEEMTLHMIRMHKRINELESKINLQK